MLLFRMIEYFVLILFFEVSERQVEPDVAALGGDHLFLFVIIAR